jgi:predicted SprT family Zn-dependent metalloprotease
MKLLKQIFKEINTDVFGGCLDMPVILCMHDGEHFGWYLDNKEYHVININPAYCHDYDTAFHTMAHEMCHYADRVFYRKKWKHLTHKGRFAKMASEIEKIYNLKRGTI